MLIDHAAGKGDAAQSTARAQVVTLHLIKQYIVPCINVKNLKMIVYTMVWMMIYSPHYSLLLPTDSPGAVYFYCGHQRCEGT